MSTATSTGPDSPLRAVWTPADTESVRESIQTQKNRFGAFLTARDLILGAVKTAGSTLAEIAERWHLGGLLHAAQRSLGWLIGGFALVRRGLSTAGVRPGIVWMLCTELGQQVLGKAIKVVGKAVSAVVGMALKATTWTLRLCGAWGKAKAAQLEAKAASAVQGLKQRLAPVQTMGSVLLDPAGLPLQALASVARGRVLNALVSRFLPRPWSILARVFVSLAAVPGQLRRQALQAIVWATPDATPGAKEPVEPTDPEPTPPAAPAAAVRPVSPLFTAPVAVPDLKEPEIEEKVTLVVVEDVVLEHAVGGQPGLQRYPAKRSSNARRKR